MYTACMDVHDTLPWRRRIRLAFLGVFIPHVAALLPLPFAYRVRPPWFGSGSAIGRRDPFLLHGKTTVHLAFDEGFTLKAQPTSG
jgi:hypothetical protein